MIPRALGYASVVAGMLTGLPLILANWHAVVAVVGIDHRAPDAIVGLWRSMLHGIATGHGFGAINTLTPPNYGHDAHAVGLQVPDSWWWHVVAHHVPHLLGLLVLLCAGGAIIAATLAAARTGEGGVPGRRPAPAGSLGRFSS